MNFDLLKQLCETPGISGSEDRIRDLVAAEMRPLVDTLNVDVMGNLIGIRGGVAGGPRVMIATHLDEIGFRVRYVEDSGFVRLHTVGGWDPRVMVAQRVLVHGYAGQSLRGALMPASKPIHQLTPEDLNKPAKIEEFYVDLGLPGDKVKELVEVGDMATMDRTCERIGDAVLSKALDNRLSVLVLLEALRKLQGASVDATIIVVATSQEEVGIRGAITSAYHLTPDIGLAVDVTIAADTPGVPETDRVTKFGGGTAIKVSDASLICHPKLVRHLRDIAQDRGIAYQLEMFPRGGTDAGGIQRARGGIVAGGISIPTRYVHTVNEMAHVDDIQGSIDLLAGYLESAHARDYNFTLES